MHHLPGVLTHGLLSLHLTDWARTGMIGTPPAAGPFFGYADAFDPRIEAASLADYR